jgi:hypothetical protein
MRSRVCLRNDPAKGQTADYWLFDLQFVQQCPQVFGKQLN